MPTMCLYCSKPVKRVKQGEHVIPEAIGGAQTLKNVCAGCNNRFSIIDTELCSRSPLSVVASQQLDAHLWQAWDVDHSEAELLLEAWPDWSKEILTLYPQMVFDRDRPLIRGDYDELQQFGTEDFARVFVKGMLRSFQHHEANEKRWLHFERIDREHLQTGGYRLPPRIFPRMTIFELARRVRRNQRASFVLRYHTTAEKRRVLNALDTWRPPPRRTRPSLHRSLGSHLPLFCYVYDAAKVLRAITKIAINLLAHCCNKTAIRAETFQSVIRVIRGESPVSPQLLNANGFVSAADVQAINAGRADHSFRLLHLDGQWLVHSCFFGGRIGTFVSFPGPNNEDWCCADIVAPLRSSQWTIRTSKVIQPLPHKIDWHDPKTIMPTIPLLQSRTQLKIERVREHPARLQ